MKKEKRMPTLFDHYVMVKGHDGPPLSRWLESHRFIFDDKASTFLGNLLRRAPLEVLQEHEFARPPYDVTWIEFDHLAYWDALKVPGYLPDDETDTKVGFLYDHNRVWMIATSKHSPDPGLIPLIVNLHQPINPDQEMQFAETLDCSRKVLRNALLGNVNVDPRSDWWLSDEASDICRSHRLEWYTKGDYGRMGVQENVRLMRGCVGHLKLVLTCALLLSRPANKVLTNSEVTPFSTIFKGRRVNFKAHHVVTVRLAHRDPIVRFTTALATGLHRRRHGVRGHWAQSRKLAHRGCDHRWDYAVDGNLIVVNFKDKYQCVLCGAKRWWVKAHSRGDATRGFVTKEYDVTE